MKLLYINLFFLALIIYHLFFTKIIENYECDISKPSNEDCQDLTMDKNETRIADLKNKITELARKKQNVAKMHEKNNNLILKNNNSLKKIKDSL